MKHFGRRSWSPTRVKTRDEHDSKWPEDRSVNMQIFRDSTKKRRSLDSKIQALTAKKTTSKAHMQVHTNKGSREKKAWRKPGPNRAETGLRRPAWADRLSPFRARFGVPFDLAASRAICSPLAESHKEIHSSSIAEEQRREGHHSGEERVEMVD
jgi:hypothetical protein